MPMSTSSPSLVIPALSPLLQGSVQSIISLGRLSWPLNKITSPCYSHGLSNRTAPSQRLSWWLFCLFSSDYVIYSLSHPLDYELLEGKDYVCFIYLFICVKTRSIQGELSLLYTFGTDQLFVWSLLECYLQIYCLTNLTPPKLTNL